MRVNKLAVMLFVLAGALAFLPAARADQWNHMTRVTFAQPVEIPGTVLPPGTYVFKLLDSQVDRNIVQVFNEDQSHVFATLLAIPDYRVQPADKTIVLFEEREAGAPQAIRVWFYPGDNYGNAFVYPQPQAAALAKANNQPVPTMSEKTKNEMGELRNTPLMTQQPGGEQTKPEPQAQAQPTPQPQQQAQATTQPVTPPEPHAEAQQPQAENQPAPAPQPQQELPKTASDMPLVGLLGLVSLALAGALRLAHRRSA